MLLIVPRVPILRADVALCLRHFTSCFYDASVITMMPLFLSTGNEFAQEVGACVLISEMVTLHINIWISGLTTTLIAALG